MNRTKLKQRLISAQWRSFDKVLFWINTQDEQLIDKARLYHAVMAMRPDPVKRTYEQAATIAYLLSIPTFIAWCAFDGYNHRTVALIWFCGMVAVPIIATMVADDV